MPKGKKTVLKTPSDSMSVEHIAREKRSAVIQLLAGILPTRPISEFGPEYTEQMERLIRQCTVIAEMVYCVPSGYVIAHAYQLFKEGEVLGAPTISKRLKGLGWKGASERSLSGILQRIRKALKDYVIYMTAFYDNIGTLDPESEFFLTKQEFKQAEIFVKGKKGYETRAILKICHDRNICSEFLWQQIPATPILSGADNENRDALPSVYTLGRAKVELMRMRDAHSVLITDFNSELNRLSEILKDTTDPKRPLEIIERMNNKLIACSKYLKRLDAGYEPEVQFTSQSARKRA